MLIAAIWFVALLALVAAIIAGWLYRSLDRAEALQQRLAARAQAISAVDEIAYLMLTGYYSPRGLELGDAGPLASQLMPNTLAYALRHGTPHIALDDRPYRFGKAIVRLQDARGLFNLGFPDRPMFRALMASYGIPFDARGPLYDRLRDYMDKSPFTRLNGASASDYLAAGQPPPRDAPLLTPWEAYRVLGWKQYGALWRGPDALPDIATVGTAVGLNPNTAPPRVLYAIPGMDRRAVARIVNYRQHR